MQKEPKIYIEHMLSCIQNIQTYIGNLSKDNFMDNKLVQDAVIRNFEVMGEASKNITKSFQEQFPQLPWTQMKGMRNILIHDYMKVDLEAVWETIINYLPVLKTNLENIINYQAKHPG